MPAQTFTVHVDPDDLARQNLAAAVALPSVTDGDPDRRGATPAERHGARDERVAARLQSERERSSRASGVGHGRSYVFRRS
jgi:hypothetical protein